MRRKISKDLVARLGGSNGIKCMQKGKLRNRFYDISNDYLRGTLDLGSISLVLGLGTLDYSFYSGKGFQDPTIENLLVITGATIGLTAVLGLGSYIYSRKAKRIEREMKQIRSSPSYSNPANYSTKI